MKNHLADSRGNITVTVVAILFLTLVIATLVMSYASNQSLWELVTESQNDALYFANDGYNQTLFELNKNSTFYSESGSGFTKVTDDATQQVWRRSAAAGDNYAVEIVIPKSGGTLSEDLATVRVTGWTSDRPDAKRTIEAGLQRRNILDYAALLRTMPSNLVYGQGEAVFGPAHSNGDFRCDKGARFWGLVTMVGNLYVQNKLTSVPIAEGDTTFREGAMRISEIAWPRDNTSLKTWAQMPGGAYYSGRTCIYLNDSTYRVRSWDSVNSRWLYNGVPYSIVTISSQKYYHRIDTNQNYASWSAFKATCPELSLPTAGIIYVDGTQPSYYGTSPNYDWQPADYTSKFDPQLGNVFIAGRLQGELSVAAAGDIFITASDPTEWENGSWNNRTSDGRYDGLTYTNTTFQVYSQGNPVFYLPPDYLDPNNINSSHPLESVTVVGGNDVLGLCANYCVKLNQFNWPRQPEWDTNGGNYWGGNTSQTRINVVGQSGTDHMYVCAAIFAINGTYSVERYNDSGSSQRRRDTIGSIAMNVTTPTYTGGNGYRESNLYDPRLDEKSPPHFLVPQCVGWGQISWREVNTIVP